MLNILYGVYDLRRALETSRTTQVPRDCSEADNGGDASCHSTVAKASPWKQQIPEAGAMS